MRMKLKNKSSKINIKKLKKYFNSKTFFIVILTIFLISIIFSIIYFSLLSKEYKLGVYKSIEKTFIYKDYNYLEIFKKNLVSNTFSTLFIWLLGISAIGIIFIIFILFSEGFGFGLYISSAISKYGLKGLILVLCNLLSGRILYLLLIIFLTYKSIIFSYKLIKYLIFKKDIDIRGAFKKYFKILIFSIIVSIAYSIIITFFSPIIYNVFTFFTK